MTMFINKLQKEQQSIQKQIQRLEIGQSETLATAGQPFTTHMQSIEDEIDQLQVSIFESGDKHETLMTDLKFELADEKEQTRKLQEELAKC